MKHIPLDTSDQGVYELYMLNACRVYISKPLNYNPGGTKILINTVKINFYIELSRHQQSR